MLVLGVMLIWFCVVTAFIQSDTILEVLHFGEGSLLQVRIFIIFFLAAFIEDVIVSIKYKSIQLHSKVVLLNEILYINDLGFL